MVVKLLQQKKQYDPNDVTEEGILMEVKPLQFEKQYSSTEVIESGISIKVKPLQIKVFTTDYYSIFYR